MRGARPQAARPRSRPPEADASAGPGSARGYSQRRAAQALPPPRGKGRNEFSDAAIRNSSEPPRSRGKGGRSDSRPPSSRRRSASVPREKLSWDNPEGTPVEEVEDGAVVEGVVTNVSPYGVFIDIGAVRNARLDAPRNIQRLFKRGDRLLDLVVSKLFDSDRLTVSLDDPEGAVQINRKPMEELEEGSYVHGVVNAKGPYGVFVNIGAERDGRLQVPKSLAFQFLRGQLLKDVRIDSVDLDMKRIYLSVEDPLGAANDILMVGLQPFLRPAPALRQRSRGPRARSGRDRDEAPSAQSDWKGGNSDWSEYDSKPEPPESTPRSATRNRSNGRAPKQPQEEERKICKYFAAGSCSYGKYCGYAHDLDAPVEMAEVEPHPRVCKFFAEGNCTYGAYCGFLHELPAEANPGPGAKTTKSSRNAWSRSDRQASSVPALSVGDLADGMVTSLTPRGALVDIGLDQPGVLLLSPALKAEFQKGDQVHGMQVASVSPTGSITLTMEEPELEVIPIAEQPTFVEPEQKASSRGRSKGRQRGSH